MGIYGDLLKRSGVLRIFASQLTARMPYGMFSLVAILHVELLHQSYSAAGLVLAASSIGQAIAGPLTSRWMGQWGMRRVLILTTLVSAMSMTLIGLVFMPVWLTMAVAFVMGMSMPPVSSAVRTIYPKMVPGTQLPALFSLDATAQELIFILGPFIAVVIASQVSTTAGMMAAVAFLAIGGAWFISSPELGKVRIPRSAGRFGSVLLRTTVLTVVLVELLFIASFAAIEVAVVANYERTSIESGIVLGIFSVGSVIGGLIAGHRGIGPYSLATRISVVFIGAVLVLFNQSTLWLSISLFISGFGVAPALAALYTYVSATVKFSETAEAFGWLSSGMLVGGAFGSAVAGFAIDSGGPVQAMWVSALFLFITIIGALFAARFLPDLRGEEMQQLPETGPVRLPHR